MRAFLAICITLTIGACAADDPVASPTTTEPTVAESSTPSTPTSGDDESGGSTISIQGFSFGVPIEVSVGSTVTVVNLDASVHTWTSDDGLFDSGNLATDQEFTHVFVEPGEFGFFCVIHPGMTGAITVAG